MSSVCVQKSTYVIVIKPEAITMPDGVVEYYKDPRTMDTITTRSFISAEWFDEKERAHSMLLKLKKGKSKKLFAHAKVSRLIIGLQDEAVAD